MKLKTRLLKKYCYIGKDNNIYVSLLELKTGNHLFYLVNNNKIKDYEYEAKVCKEKSWTCDFLIFCNSGNKVWLEIDGMRKNRKYPYLLGENNKIEYYKINNFDYAILSYNNRDLIKSINSLLGVI